MARFANDCMLRFNGLVQQLTGKHQMTLLEKKNHN